MNEVLVLGAGYTGTRVLLRARALGVRACAAVRSDDHGRRLQALGIEAVVDREFGDSLRSLVRSQTHVVIAFPPDGSTDARVAPLLRPALSVTYVSSTAVYADVHGRIDDWTELPPPTPRTLPRLQAEALYRSQGGTVLRAPGIYGPERGLHTRVLRGDYRLPGDGNIMLSRVHVVDLARFILAASKVRGETFVVGDLEPATHRKVVSWICQTYAVPFPPSVPVEEVHYTLRANRAVDSGRARQVLGVELEYPSYREGMSKASLEQEQSV